MSYVGTKGRDHTKHTKVITRGENQATEVALGTKRVVLCGQSHRVQTKATVSPSWGLFDAILRA